MKDRGQTINKLMRRDGAKTESGKGKSVKNCAEGEI